MSTPDPTTGVAPGRRRPRARIALLGTLLVSWIVLVPFLYRAVTTVPSAARLQAMSSRIMHPPTPATFLRLTGQSFLEMAVVALLLWPWWPRLWLTRLALAFLALGVWAVVTVPLELTDLEWVHHRWMVGVDLLLAAAFLASAVTRVAGRMRSQSR